MGQSWRNLLFAHWPMSPAKLAPLIPPGSRLDTYDGAAWIGITPFAVLALRGRVTPPLPVLSRFLEANLRTYVSVGGKPGVFFFTLDASSSAAVMGGRYAYGLPYRKASVHRSHESGLVHHRSESNALRFDAHYRGEGPGALAAPGSLEAFLVERYCLYTLRAGKVRRVDIHHPPWLLQSASADTMIDVQRADPIGLPAPAAMFHVALRQDVLVWAPTSAR
jgi:uncharacterized protein YqjF (DUF2071 family)